MECVFTSTCFFTVANILEFLELSSFLNDGTTLGNCDVFIRKNMCDELLMKIHDTPNVRDTTRVHVENYLNASKLKEELLMVEKIVGSSDTHYQVKLYSTKNGVNRELNFFFQIV